MKLGRRLFFFFIVLLGILACTNAFALDYNSEWVHFSFPEKGKWVEDKASEGLTYYYFFSSDAERVPKRDGSSAYIRVQEVDSPLKLVVIPDVHLNTLYDGLMNGSCIYGDLLGDVKFEDMIIGGIQSRFIEFDELVNKKERHVVGLISYDGDHLCVVRYVNANRPKKELRDEFAGLINSYGLNVKIRYHEEPILFRKLPWLADFKEVDLLTNDLQIEVDKKEKDPFTINDICISDEYDGVDFDYDDLGFICRSANKVKVAGYTSTETNLFFSYHLSEEKPEKSIDDALLYGAQYVIEPKDISEAAADLIAKLSSQYGEPAKEYKIETPIKKFSISMWYGKDNTAVVLNKSVSLISSFYKDSIIISYVYLKGDDLLHNVNDFIMEHDENAEYNNYGNGNTDGL